jgi:hypothetical protein
MLVLSSPVIALVEDHLDIQAPSFRGSQGGNYRSRREPISLHPNVGLGCADRRQSVPNRLYQNLVMATHWGLPRREDDVIQDWRTREVRHGGSAEVRF